MKTQNYIQILEKEIQAREVKLKAVGLNPFMTKEEKIVKAQVFVFVKKKFYGNFWKIKN